MLGIAQPLSVCFSAKRTACDLGRCVCRLLDLTDQPELWPGGRGELVAPPFHRPGRRPVPASMSVSLHDRADLPARVPAADGKSVAHDHGGQIMAACPHRGAGAPAIRRAFVDLELVERVESIENAPVGTGV